MNNSDASYDAGSSKQIYQHTYNLWKSSEFYNINNLSAYNLLGLDNPDQSFSVFSTPSIIPTPETTAPETSTSETSAPETSASATSASEPSPPVISVPSVSVPVISLAEPSTSFWDTEKPEPARDSQNRRIISKVSLYEEPVLGEKKEDPVEVKQEVANDWTSEFWMKAGNGGDRTFNQKQPRKQAKNNIQKKLDIALSQPLKIDKAASMMAKMGWEGGALGKTGTGIVEPIAPNAVYATQTTGFGQLELADRRRPRKPQVQSTKHNGPQKKPKKLRVECFNTNLMLQTLAFVRNDYEIEVMFDSKLTRYERKRIHDFIDDIMYIEDMIGMPCDNDEQMEMAIEIRKYNNYLLRTVSEGEMPDRSLCLYKEPPDNMYLVTHFDLRDEPEEVFEEVFEIVDNKTTESASLGNDEKAVETIEKPDEIVQESNATIEKDADVTANNENAVMTDVDKVVEDATKTNDKEMTDVNQDPAKEETTKTQSKVFKLNLEGTKYECYMVKNKQTKKKRNKEKKENRERENAKVNIEKKVTKTNTKPTKFCKVTTNMLAKVDNPFLKSILSVQKESINEPLTKNDLKNQILAYFTEFSKKKTYTQFKFLGAFEGIEIEAINEFINNVWMCLNDGDYMSDDILSVMREAKCGFAIKEDSNGSAVIYKKKKDELGGLTGECASQICSQGCTDTTTPNNYTV